MASPFPPETVAVTIDGQRFAGRRQRDLTMWAVYIFEQGFHLYLSPDEAMDRRYLTVQILALRGRGWEVGSHSGARD